MGLRRSPHRAILFTCLQHYPFATLPTCNIIRLQQLRVCWRFPREK
ncbi:hypothetical protein YPPY66_4851 [Yersinia pestis PY-66]|nr:hypothetical protein [Yersinia pestis]EDR33818.1 hypothetical protein YPIP275_4517 [Yersinia pestis biovar Orientalis str. IP275]EDR43844.1 hypothetical protein YpE1979001_3822 [Yersinia pestis biovar Antiqua str. E1979001]EDR49892.1 hypothetical protein YpB42003004_2815 [Yersinia pestis biovar Antiqua str. B42003004]EDR57166.1 hypothetical protein YpMG051020_1415 [Yersinia pestis biovar Orientalis str. MG05-1020]EDR64299.1 hypothetical protein YpK1973002_1521 [Yersinia pestis biovar Mediae